MQNVLCIERITALAGKRRQLHSSDVIAYTIYLIYCIYSDGTHHGIADAIALAIALALAFALALALALALAPAPAPALALHFTSLARITRRRDLAPYLPLTLRLAQHALR